MLCTAERQCGEECGEECGEKGGEEGGEEGVEEGVEWALNPSSLTCSLAPPGAGGSFKLDPSSVFRPPSDRRNTFQPYDAHARKGEGGGGGIRRLWHVSEENCVYRLEGWEVAARVVYTRRCA